MSLLRKTIQKLHFQLQELQTCNFGKIEKNTHQFNSHLKKALNHHASKDCMTTSTKIEKEGLSSCCPELF